jgi:hypothetical protein
MKNFVQPGDSLGMAVPYVGGVTAGHPSTPMPRHRRG